MWRLWGDGWLCRWSGERPAAAAAGGRSVRGAAAATSAATTAAAAAATTLGRVEAAPPHAEYARLADGSRRRRGTRRRWHDLRAAVGAPR